MSRSEVRTCRPAELSPLLQLDLTRYAIAAIAAGVGVISLATPSEAEIVHTKVDRVIGRGESYNIDLNHDGIVDFSIQNIFNRCTRTFSYCPEVEIVASPANGNEIEYGFHNWYAAAVRPGAVIGSAAPMNNALEFMADEFRSAGAFYYFGSWLNATDRFLGLSFEVQGEIHYGWARLTVRSREKYHLTAFISDFAYETEPNTPIKAGSTNDEDSATTDAPVKTNPADVSEGALGALALGASARQ